MMYNDAQKAQNREVLAAYLAALPADYIGFEMADFFQSLDLTKARDDYLNDEITYDTVRKAMEDAARITADYARNNGGVAQCGAVACAVGHGPSAGFLLIDADFHSAGSPNWTAYVQRVFLDLEDHDEPSDEYNYSSRDFGWMFGGDWSATDNTPHGAAARIRYFNAHGVPDDFDEDDFDTFDPALYA